MVTLSFLSEIYVRTMYNQLDNSYVVDDGDNVDGDDDDYDDVMLLSE